MKKHILETQNELGLSLSKLSQLIGHHSNYLSRALRDGVSTAKQAEIIKKLDDLKSNVNADKEQYVLARYHQERMAELMNESDTYFKERNGLQQTLDRVREQMRIAENEFTALEASYKNALERERNLSDSYDNLLKEMAAAKSKELYWWVALLIVSVVVIALVAL